MFSCGDRNEGTRDLYWNFSRNNNWMNVSLFVSEEFKVNHLPIKLVAHSLLLTRHQASSCQRNNPSLENSLIIFSSQKALIIFQEDVESMKYVPKICVKKRKLNFRLEKFRKGKTSSQRIFDWILRNFSQKSIDKFSRSNGKWEASLS